MARRVALSYREDIDRVKKAAHDSAEHRAYDWPVPGPNGETYQTHTFWVGPRDAKRVLVLITGTHGSENKAGATVVRQLLEAPSLLQMLGKDTALLIIFGLNAEACELELRVGRDNVDGNRGTGPLFKTRAVAPDVLKSDMYREYQRYVMPQVMTYETYEHLQELAQDRTFATLMMSGQYDHQEGFGYGGDRICQSGLMATRICQRELTRAERVAVLDVHTGLVWSGTYLSTTHDLKQAELTREWLGSGVQFINLGESVSAPMGGTTLQLFERLLAGRDVLTAAIEMQAKIVQPLAVLLAEHSARYYGHRMDHRFLQRIRLDYPTAFWDGSLVWRGRFFQHSLRAVQGMFGYLHS